MGTVWFGQAASGDTFTIPQRVAGEYGPPFFSVPSVAAPAAITIQCAPSSAGPWGTLARPDGSGLPFVICSSVPGCGIGPRVVGFVRLAFGAPTAVTSIKCDFLNVPG
ncbi:MAG: hypothetical protein U0807_03480 [Candidatus Binatia bacterium]